MSSLLDFLVLRSFERLLIRRLRWPAHGRSGDISILVSSLQTYNMAAKSGQDYYHVKFVCLHLYSANMFLNRVFCYKKQKPPLRLLGR